MLTACVLLVCGLQSGVPKELNQYVFKPDESFSWSRKTIDGHEGFELLSQTWKGAPWKHDIVLIQPDRPAELGAMIIEVTGWEPNQTDYKYGKMLADASGLPVAILFQMPNQPIDGREEDDLIAHTFEQYFMTGDAEWPVLFPMVKSVVRTMDMLEEALKGSSQPIKKFFITGASKRGWTAWLTGATKDKRIVGIAPAVFDNLGFVTQLERQQEYWNAYSPMIADYTDRGLQDLLGTEPGKKLIRMVDPLSYLPAISVPTLVLTGTNDPFWTVDSLQVYWDKMLMPKSALAIPNAGHGMGDKNWWAPSLGKFALWSAKGERMPYIGTNLTIEDDHWELKIDVEPGPVSYRVWQATSPDLHFEKVQWRVVQEEDVAKTEGKRGIWVSGDRPRTSNLAMMVEMEFEVSGHSFRLTTPVQLIRKR